MSVTDPGAEERQRAEQCPPQENALLPIVSPASFDSLSLDGPGCLGVLCLELLFCIGAELAWHSENTQQICMHVYSCDLNLFMLPISP